MLHKPPTLPSIMTATTHLLHRYAEATHTPQKNYRHPYAEEKLPQPIRRRKITATHTPKKNYCHRFAEVKITATHMPKKNYRTHNVIKERQIHDLINFLGIYTIQTVNSPLKNMSAPGNAAKLGTAQSHIQAAQSWHSLVGIEPTMH